MFNLFPRKGKLLFINVNFNFALNYYKKLVPFVSLVKDSLVLGDGGPTEISTHLSKLGVGRKLG